MEMVDASFEKISLISELTEGKELATQLKKQIDDPATSNETCEELLQKMISIYDKAIARLNFQALKRPRSAPIVELKPSDDHSLHVTNCSPRSDCSDHVSKDQESHKNVFKKRKTLPKWSEQVRVCSGTGVEGTQNDGHSWRKYGQKDILGAKFPRAYYRCTHRNTRGCLATKQVQRSEEDVSVFEVTYKARHSCIQASYSPSKIALVDEEIVKPSGQDQLHIKMDSLIQEQPAAVNQMLKDLQQGLKVETEFFTASEENLPYFSFPWTPIETEDVESPFFSNPTKESDLIDSYLSPTVSEYYNNYVSSPSQINIFDNLQEYSKCQLSGGISTPTSVTESPFGDLDCMLDHVDFDPTFSLENLECFS